MTPESAAVADAVRVLSDSPDHRILTRLDRRAAYHAREADTPVRVALYVDVETTGLGADAQLIEFGAVRFSCDDTGRVYDVGPSFSEFNDPGAPIPEDITKITGITDDDVRGHAVVWREVAPLFDGVSLVIAHNASFDRPVLERHLPEMPALPWACSYSEVPWRYFGVEGGKLRHILADACGVFYDAHRALDDCFAGIHALATAKAFGAPAMRYLFDAASETSARVWALGAPFSTKDVLKARGYRWNDGSDGRPKSWYTDVPAANLEDERAWLLERAFLRHPKVEMMTARSRYSGRPG